MVRAVFSKKVVLCPLRTAALAFHVRLFQIYGDFFDSFYHRSSFFGKFK